MDSLQYLCHHLQAPDDISLYFVTWTFDPLTPKSNQFTHPKVQWSWTFDRIPFNIAWEIICWKAIPSGPEVLAQTDNPKA